MVGLCYGRAHLGAFGCGDDASNLLEPGLQHGLQEGINLLLVNASHRGQHDQHFVDNGEGFALQLWPILLGPAHDHQKLGKE